jgi:AcrR family transcriptional regulator
MRTVSLTGAARQTPRTEGSDVPNATCQTQTRLHELDGFQETQPGGPGPRVRPGSARRRLAADRAAAGRAAMLADEWVRRAAAASVAAVLQADGYDSVSFQSVARRAGLNGDDVRRVFPSKAEMVLKALRPASEQPAGRSAFTSSGEIIVARFLRFWQADDNALILRSLLCASLRDPRLAARMEAHIVGTLIRPFAEDVGATDAYPRARLAFSQLLGLAVSRYLLPQEPLASADIETIAAWAGPSLDYCLRGELGGACAPCGSGATHLLAPSRGSRAARPIPLALSAR